jgi:hypothetical protein
MHALTQEKSRFEKETPNGSVVDKRVAERTGRSSLIPAKMKRTDAEDELAKGVLESTDAIPG